MSNQLEIVTQPALPVARVPDVASMLQAVVERGVSNENVEALEKLVELYERMQAKDAEKQFAAAFVKLQAELPTIVAETVIPNRGKYARFEDVMRQIAAPLRNNGFSIAFSNETHEGRVVETCHLMHVSGHSRSSSFAIRLGRADNEAQADCKAATTAKRKALQDALNIVIRQDCLNEEADASMEGNPNEFITSEQADELERRVAETNSNRAAFLKFAGADKFATILSAKYDACDQMLRRKEGGR